MWIWILGGDREGLYGVRMEMCSWVLSGVKIGVVGYRNRL